MAKFDVSHEVDELSYDFTKFVPGAEGVIPEPTTDQLTAFRRVIFESIPVKPSADGLRVAIDFETLKAKIEEDNDEGQAIEARLYQAVADLCSNTPSVGDIKALPPRGQKAFVGWIMGTFLRPEASAPATTA